MMNQKNLWIALITPIVAIFVFAEVYILFALTQLFNQMDKRFSEVNQRINSLRLEMNQRLSDMDANIRQLNPELQSPPRTSYRRSRKTMCIKKTLQSETWDRFLRQEAEAGNEDVIEILQVDQKEQVAPLSTTSTTKAQLGKSSPPNCGDK